jgi:hypothetical protein
MALFDNLQSLQAHGEMKYLCEAVQRDDSFGGSCLFKGPSCATPKSLHRPTRGQRLESLMDLLKSVSTSIYGEEQYRRLFKHVLTFAVLLFEMLSQSTEDMIDWCDLRNQSLGLRICVLEGCGIFDDSFGQLDASSKDSNHSGEISHIDGCVPPVVMIESPTRENHRLTSMAEYCQVDEAADKSRILGRSSFAGGPVSQCPLHISRHMCSK